MVQNRTEFTSIKKGFALAATKVTKTSFKGVSINYEAASVDSSSSNFSLTMESKEGSKDSTASLILPSNLLSNLKNDVTTLVFVAYDQSKLFQQKRGGLKLNSKIISAQVRNNDISGLSSPIITKFKDSNASDAERFCAWWDFSLNGMYSSLSVFLKGVLQPDRETGLDEVTINMTST